MQDRAAIEQRAIRNKIKEMGETADPSQLAQLETALNELDSKIRGASEELDKLFDREDQVKEKIASHREGLQTIENELQELNDRVSALSQWAADNPGDPTVKVYGTAFPGTVVKRRAFLTGSGHSFQRRNHKGGEGEQYLRRDGFDF